MKAEMLLPRVCAALDGLEEHCRAADHRGPDPYDGLLSPAAALARSKTTRQVLVQSVKRSPVNLRPLLRVPAVRMSKTLALFVQGYVLAPHLSDTTATVAALRDDLVASQLPSGGWGYEFDVQTRWGYYPVGTPNMVATAFALEALHLTGAPEATFSSARRWLVDSMAHPDGYFRYVPDNDSLVHNASALGARALARVAQTPDDRGLVQRAVELLVAAPAPGDAFWPYGTNPGLEWVDCFHTVYVLDCLTDLEEAGYAVGIDLREAVAQLAETFVRADGQVAYYQDGTGPLDVHNVASTVDLFARYPSVASTPRVHAALEALLRFQREDGGFAIPGKPSYMRWNNAHTFRALARWQKALA